MTEATKTHDTVHFLVLYDQWVHVYNFQSATDILARLSKVVGTRDDAVVYLIACRLSYFTQFETQHMIYWNNAAPFKPWLIVSLGGARTLCHMEQNAWHRVWAGNWCWETIPGTAHNTGIAIFNKQRALCGDIHPSILNHCLICTPFCHAKWNVS